MARDRTTGDLMIRAERRREWVAQDTMLVCNDKAEISLVPPKRSR
jgi:hypothetical protein